MSMDIVTKTNLPALVTEQKSGQAINSPVNFVSFMDFLQGNSLHDLSAHVALTYYRKVSPIFDAVDRLTDEMASIRPVIYDKKKEEYITDHPLLDLLNRPNAFQSGDLFIKEMATYFLVTGNTYIEATGAVNRPALELFTDHPSNITITADQNDGYPDKYSVTTKIHNENFKREEFGTSYRYLNDFDTREILHIKTVNPTNSMDYLYGMSRLTPIYYEIEQYMNASVHNLALLKNGATPSGVLSTEQNLNDDQYQRLLLEMNKFFQGAENAGRPMVAEGGLKYSSISHNNKDMDFLNLKKDVRDMLYSNLRIPLAYISRDQMTMSNMDAAKYIFYDNAVLPFYKRLMNDLGDKLMPRYGLDPDQFDVTYEESSIPTLVMRHFEETKELNSMSVLSKNEIRTRLGYDEKEGLDDVLQPANLIPAGEEPAALIPPKPAGSPIDDEEKGWYIFHKALSAKLDEAGQRLYSDDEIKLMAIEERLIDV